MTHKQGSRRRPIDESDAGHSRQVLRITIKSMFKTIDRGKDGQN